MVQCDGFVPELEVCMARPSHTRRGYLDGPKIRLLHQLVNRVNQTVNRRAASVCLEETHGYQISNWLVLSALWCCVAPPFRGHEGSWTPWYKHAPRIV